MRRRDDLSPARAGSFLWSGVVLLGASLGLGCCSDAAAGAATSRPNVLVLTIDTLRSDALGCYGNDGGHTPRLDDLAARATLFANSLAPIATTFPSHASMFTGVYPRVHGLRWNGQSLSEDWTTLAERLAGEGYATGAFVSYKSMVNRGGLGQGFAAVSDPEPMPWDGARPGDETIAMALDWLEQQAGPFFLWVHLFEPHSPYPVTEYFRAATGDYDGVFRNGLTAEEMQALDRAWMNDPVERAAMAALYHGRVRDADRLAGVLFDHLEARGRAANTIVAVLGDHGQLLGEHRLVGHGRVLWDEVIATPMMLFDPRVVGGGRRVADRVGVIDLTPTVLDLLALPVPAGLQGRSLAAAVRGGEIAPVPYFAEVRVKNEGTTPEMDAADPVAVYADRYKLVVEGDDTVLFDVVADPGELNPVPAADRPKIAVELEVLARRHQELVSGEVAVEAALDAEALEELRSLGYVK